MLLYATLAAGGECPLSKKAHVTVDGKYVLTLMYSCACTTTVVHGPAVGVPAKSGVAGVIQMVFPNIGGCDLVPIDSRNYVLEVSKRLCRYFRMSILSNQLSYERKS